MKVLLLSSSYPPEVRSASHLMYECATGLAKRGHCVTVVTANPGYHLADDVKKPRNRLLHIATEDGVRVIRVWSVPFHLVGPIVRGIGQLTLAFVITIGGWFAGPADVVLAYSPPLTMGVAARWLGRMKRAPYVVNIQDLFPQNAIDVGVLKNKVLIKFFQAMEAFVYRRAECISVHSESNKQWIRHMTDGRTVVEVVHNWIDVDEFAVDSDAGEMFRARYDFRNRFIVLFAGVMGYAQDLDTVIEAARRLHHRQEILFLLVGDGVEKARLEKKVQQLGLTNVRFFPFVSKQEYPHLVAASNVGLVTLKKSMKTPVVPSKILGYMAGGKPVVASLNQESDGIAIIEQSQCGVNAPAETPGALAQAIEQLYHSRGQAQTMGQNGRAFAVQHFSKEIGLNHYEALFGSLQSSRPRRRML